ncbi:MAG: mechanosensitive ion channel [Candidatus Krumholzibacteria bacterium]|nr:mechanosensitive ion channel [Candidatus Krumholzibacteria bacterium]
MTRNRGIHFLTVPTMAFLALLLLLVPISLFAQDQDPDVEKRGVEVLDRLDKIIAEGQSIRDKQGAASAEDSLVLRLQLAKTRDRFMETLDELAKIVTAIKGDEAHGQLRERAEDVYEKVTPRLWELIRELRLKIDDLRAKRPDTPVAERLALEADLALLADRLDGFFKHGWDNIENLDGFGRDTAQEREDFSGLLTDRADELSGRMDLATLRINELGGRLKDAPGDADLTVLLTANKKNLKNVSASQAIILDIMDSMEMPNDIYRTQLLATTQDLASGLLDISATRTIVSQAWNGITNWVTDNGPSYLVKIILFLLIFIVGRFLAHQISHIVEKSLARSKVNMSHLLKRMTVTFTKNAIIVLALVFGLAQLGFSLGPLLAGFGVVGFILGFAMQDSLSNLAAGMMILINRPYDVGDLVDISGVFGKVENMSMVSTSILTLDNQKLVVPNSKIWGDVIKNVTDQRIRRVDMTFGIAYTDDIPHAEEVLKDILEKHERVLDKPESMVRLHTLGESSVDFIVRPWVKTDDYWDIYWDVTRAVKMRFDEEGISIPFPQQDIHIYEESKIAEGKAVEGDFPKVPTTLEQAPVKKTGQDEPGQFDSDDD